MCGIFAARGLDPSQLKGLLNAHQVGDRLAGVRLLSCHVHNPDIIFKDCGEVHQLAASYLTHLVMLLPVFIALARGRLPALD